MFTQYIHALKLRVSMPRQHVHVLSLWESYGEDVYETQGGYLPAKASDDDC